MFWIKFWKNKNKAFSHKKKNCLITQYIYFSKFKKIRKIRIHKNFQK